MAWRRRKSPSEAAAPEAEAAGPQIEAPNQSELDWVSANLAIARELAAPVAGAGTSTTLDPDLLDAAYAAWYAEWESDPPDQRNDPNPFINAFGIAFGQHLVDTLALEWVVATDEYGTEIAVHGQPGDVLAFPPNLVAKRFERGETGFLAPLYEAISGEIRGLR